MFFSPPLEVKGGRVCLGLVKKYKWGWSREGVGHEVLSLVQGVGHAIFSYPYGVGHRISLHR